MTKKKLKALKRAYEECEDDTDVFFPRKSDIKHWFDFINEMMFNGLVERPSHIEIKRMRNLGQAEGDLNTGVTCMRLRDRFRAVSQRNLIASASQMFISTVAHEMVHLWQFQTDYTMNHGRGFQEWKTKFKKIGIII